MSYSNIFEYVGHNPGCTALQIKKAFKKDLGKDLDKKKINQELYGGKGKYRMIEGTPPTWYLDCNGSNELKDAKRVKINTYLFVDLGHMHDVYMEYQEEPGTIGYADASCPIQARKNDVIKGTTGHKNEADVNIIWDVAKICESRKNVTIIIATKDLGFLSIKDLAEKTGNKLYFARSLEEARKYMSV